MQNSRKNYTKINRGFPKQFLQIMPGGVTRAILELFLEESSKTP